MMGQLGQSITSRIVCASVEHAEDLLAIIPSPPCRNYLLGKFTLVFYLRARLRKSPAKYNI